MQQLITVINTAKQLLDLLERENREIPNALQADLLDAYQKLLSEEVLLIEQQIRKLRNHINN